MSHYKGNKSVGVGGGGQAADRSVCSPVSSHCCYSCYRLIDWLIFIYRWLLPFDSRDDSWWICSLHPNPLTYFLFIPPLLHTPSNLYLPPSLIFSSPALCLSNWTSVLLPPALTSSCLLSITAPPFLLLMVTKMSAARQQLGFQPSSWMGVLTYYITAGWEKNLDAVAVVCFVILILINTVLIFVNSSHAKTTGCGSFSVDFRVVIYLQPID